MFCSSLIPDRVEEKEKIWKKQKNILANKLNQSINQSIKILSLAQP
jgi:hypothetical protein